MAIQETNSLLHWNYFLALESDVERLSRFVEFTTHNFATYSIQIAHLLLAACSEVDVVAQQLCQRLDNASEADNINKYREVIRPMIPQLELQIVTVPRHGLELTPWKNWQNDRTPNWWSAYNKVKHQRSSNFEKANLENTLNAMAGLFLMMLHFYHREIKHRRMEPPPILFTPPKDLASVSGTFNGTPALWFIKES